MAEIRSKKLFIDLVLSVKDLKKSVEDCIDRANQTNTKYKSQILYLCYASVADCNESIAELDEYIGNFDKKNLEEDIIISSKTGKMLDLLMERQKTISNLLDKELNEALNALMEALNNRFE